MAGPNRRPNAGDVSMKRRDFFAAAGASAVALTTLPCGLAAQSDPAAAAEQYGVGDFVLRRARPNLSVVHRETPERLLWESEPDGNFLVCEQAVADIKAFGMPEALMIFAARSRRAMRSTIDAISAAGSMASVTGSLMQIAMPSLRRGSCCARGRTHFA